MPLILRTPNAPFADGLVNRLIERRRVVEHAAHVTYVAEVWLKVSAERNILDMLVLLCSRPIKLNCIFESVMHGDNSTNVPFSNGLIKSPRLTEHASHVYTAGIPIADRLIEGICFPEHATHVSDSTDVPCCN
jgi:hypothetical protein